MTGVVRGLVQDQGEAHVVGYVEALTEKAALGWVWCQGLTERLTVELRLNDQTLAQGCADEMRADLARGGIGDGRHAFSLPVPEEVRAHISEMRVFVVRKGQVATPLGAPPIPASEPNSNDFKALQRGVDMLVGSQRLMHRNLQAALLSQTPSLTTALSEIAAAQAGLQESINTFELFAVRLEQALVARSVPTDAAPARATLVIVAAAASLALVGSSWALWRIMGS